MTTNSCHQGVGFFYDLGYGYSLLCSALLFTWAHWQAETMGPRTPTAVFNHVKDLYDIDLTFDDLEVKVEEMGAWEQDGASEKSRKSLKVIFRDHTVAFVLEKTRVNNESLLDLAAEAFARQMKTRGDVERLDIFNKTRTRNAGILVNKVLKKFEEVEWIGAHVNDELMSKQWKESYVKAAGRAKRLEEELGDSRLVVVQYEANVKTLNETIRE